MLQTVLSTSTAKAAPAAQKLKMFFHVVGDFRRSTIIVAADIPGPNSVTRWTPMKAGLLVDAVKFGLKTEEEVLERYHISAEEFAHWKSMYKEFGREAVLSPRQVHVPLRIIKHVPTPIQPVLEVGCITYDPNKDTTKVGEMWMSLPGKHQKVLCYLMRYPRQWVHKETLIRDLYGDESPKGFVSAVNGLMCALEKFAQRNPIMIANDSYQLLAVGKNSKF